MTIPSKQSRKTTPPPPTVCSGSRGPVAKRCGRVRRADHGCSACCTLLILLVLVGFAATAIQLYRHYELSGNLHTYHDGDQVLVSKVSDDLNSELCQAYTVTPSDRADVFLTDGPAQISPTVRQVITVSDSGLMADDNFDYRAFYLLPGSEIAIRACMLELPNWRHKTEVLIIKGHKHYGSWLSDAHCDHCVSQKILMPPLGLCSFARYRVEKEDTYYVIITRAHRWGTQETVRAEVDMKVTKTIYDFTRAKQMCQMKSSCTLDLTYGAKDDVIVQFMGSDNSPVTATFFSTECHMRRVFWATVFGLVPAVIILLLLTCCWLCGHSSASHSAAMRQKKKEVGRVFTVNATHDTGSSHVINHADTTPLV